MPRKLTDLHATALADMAPIALSPSMIVSASPSGIAGPLSMR
jgi:hypothetical protein